MEGFTVPCLRDLPWCAAPDPVKKGGYPVHDEGKILTCHGRLRIYDISLPDGSHRRLSGQFIHLIGIQNGRKDLPVSDLRFTAVGARCPVNDLLSPKDGFFLCLWFQSTDAGSHLHLIRDQILNAPAVDRADRHDDALQRVGVAADNSLQSLDHRCRADDRIRAEMGVSAMASDPLHRNMKVCLRRHQGAPVADDLPGFHLRPVVKSEKHLRMDHLKQSRIDHFLCAVCRLFRLLEQKIHRALPLVPAF